MAAIKHTLPTPDGLTSLLKGLIDRPVTVKKAVAAYVPSLRQIGLIGIFVRDDDTVGGLCVCDLALSAGMAAVLTLIPAAVAAENVKKGKLDANLLENFREIMNISSQLFIGPGVPHVRFKDVVPMPPPIADKAIATLVTRPPGAAHFDVAIQGYPPGKFSVLVA